MDRLVEQRPLLLAALRYQHMGDLMRIALQVMLAIFGLVMVAALGAAIWSAQRDNDLVFEAFSVPPDFVQRGWNGQVVASQMLDKLSLMQERTSTARAASTYLNNWGRDDVKVAIPQVGISIGEFNRYLREWLGHETHINGEIVRTDNGIAITARVGGDAGETFTGPESKLSDLLTWSARSIYRRTQPYRYAVFIQNGLGGDNERERENSNSAAAVFLDELAYGPASETKWAHLGLANVANAREDFRTAVREAQASLYYDPQFGMAYNILALNEQGLGHDEAAYAAFTKGLASLNPGRDKQVVAADAQVFARDRRWPAFLHARRYANRGEEISGGVSSARLWRPNKSCTHLPCAGDCPEPRRRRQGGASESRAAWSHAVFGMGDDNVCLFHRPYRIGTTRPCKPRPPTLVCQYFRSQEPAREFVHAESAHGGHALPHPSTVRHCRCPCR